MAKSAEAARHGWRTMYGRQDSVDPVDYAEWVQRERLRDRDRKRVARAKAKALRAGEPAYPEPVLAVVDRWIQDHTRRDRDCELAEVVAGMRKAARAEGCAIYDSIQDRGIARYLRAHGFTLRRSAVGMVVQGLWIP